MLDFDQIAKMYGFFAMPASSSVEDICASGDAGKIVGVWQNNKFSLVYDYKKHTKLDFQHLDEDNKASSLGIDKINDVWQVMDLFSKGEFDLLYGESFLIDFPSEGRLLLDKLNDGSQQDLTQLSSLMTLSTAVDSPYLLNLFGKVNAFWGNASEAASLFRQAAELLPDFSEPYSNLGTLLWNVDKKSEAFLLFHESFLRNPMLETAQLNFFDSAYELGEYALIIKTLDSIEPESFDIPKEFYHHKAICHYLLSNKEKALDILETILSVDTADTDTQDLLTKLKNGRMVEAQQGA